MTDDTRLRRLDALFAERVMGYPSPNMANGAQLPAFTRSLDAAWEGFVRLRAIADDPYRGLSFHECPKGDSCQGWFAGIFSGDDGDDIIGPLGTACDGHAAHPAEALVLACLRAVGCSEEELA